MTSHYKGRSETFVSSKSANNKVLSLYNKILEHAYSDSDYWYLGGNDDLLDRLYDFDDSDLMEMGNDLQNWSLNEVEIFIQALEVDYSASHDDLLPQRAYLRGFIMTLANQYLHKEKYIVRNLFDPKDELLLGGFIQDRILLEKIKNTLDNIEAAFESVPKEDEMIHYFLNTRFVLIKQTITELLNVAS